MSQSKQYAQILKLINHVDDNLLKLKTDVHSLMSIQGTAVAEMHMLGERIDIFVNQEFFKKGLEEKKP